MKPTIRESESLRRLLLLVVACGIALALPSCGGDEDVGAPRREAAPPPPASDLVPEPAVKGCTVRFRCELPEGVDSATEIRAWWEEDADSGGGVLQPVTRAQEHIIVVVPPGEGIVTIHAAGCVVVRREVSAEADVMTDSGTLVLRRCTILEGRVVDEDGAPIDRALLWPKAGDLSVPLTCTDEDGRFEFDGLPDGQVRLLAESDDHVRKTVVVRHGPGIEQETIVLHRGGHVAGIVVDPEGRPDADAYVWIVDPLDDENRDRMAWPSVESDGTFSARLSPGRYRINGRSSGGTGSTTVEVSRGTTVKARLVLAPR